MKETLVIHITVKVQGVYFRQSAVEKAVELGLTGNVRNMPDGSVEVMATGDSHQLKNMVQWCHEGPVRARVQTVTIKTVPLQEFSKFGIER